MATSRKPKPAKHAAYVELEFLHGVGRFHCPVCGQPLIGAESGFTETPCEHVVLFHDWIGEFHPRDEKVAAVIEAAEDEAGENGYAIELLRRQFGQNVVFFEFFEPQQGSKLAEAATVVVDMGAAGILPEP